MRDPPELLHLRNQYRDQKYIELRRNAQDADDFLKALIFAEEERDRYRTRAQELEDEILILKENLTAISIGSLGIDELPTDDPTKGLSEAQTVIEAVELAKTRCNNVVFLESAYASARGSPYQQPQKVLHALLALDDVMKNWIDSLTSTASYGSWEDQMKKRGFEYSPNLSPTTKTRFRNTHTLTYDGVNILFEGHVKLGSGRPQ